MVTSFPEQDFPTKTMPRIYVILLENDKYYVGSTNQSVDERFKQHEQGGASAWTRLHSPISIHKTQESSSMFDEDRMVKECMAEFGIDNVRGGSYSEIELDDECRRLLQREISHAKGLCLLCGSTDHYVKGCQLLHSDAKHFCVRCSRPGHTINDCTAICHALGNTCLRCGFDGHTINKCFAKKHRRANTCVTCARDGHTYSSCTETTDRWGSKLGMTLEDLFSSKLSLNGPSVLVRRVKNKEKCLRQKNVS
jgi:predicted GIY-YIG superfamily endonuclease